MNVLGAWKYNEIWNIFQVIIRITNNQTNISQTVKCMFDTSFSGYLGLDIDTINSLNLPKIGEGYALTVNGTSKFENFAGKAELIDPEKNVLATIVNEEKELITPDPAIIPIQKFNIPILGMKAIKNFHWLLLPDKKLLLMID